MKTLLESVHANINGDVYSKCRKKVYGSIRRKFQNKISDSISFCDVTGPVGEGISSLVWDQVDSQVVGIAIKCGIIFLD